MPEYPDNIYTQRDLENLPGIVYDADNKKNLYAEDILNLGGEITVIEETLGENPQGSYDTVKEWLEAIVLSISGFVPTSRTISAGSGLSGGGDLSSNRTLSLDADLGDLNDVNTSSPAPVDLDYLGYDDATDTWIPMTLPSGGDGWELLDSVTLASAGTTFNSNTFTAKNFLRVYLYLPVPSSANFPALRFNGNTGGNYNWRMFQDSTTIPNSAPDGQIQLVNGTVGTKQSFSIIDITNINGMIHSVIFNTVQSASSASTSPSFYNGVGTFTNTSQITQIRALAGDGTSQMPSGSLMYIYGHD